MKHYKEIKQIDKEVAHVTCDWCKETISEFRYYDNGRFTRNYMFQEVTFRDFKEGTSSVYLQEYDLCDRCWDKVDLFLGQQGANANITKVC